MLTTDVSVQCRKFILAHWGRDGLHSVKTRPVSWVRHEANPHLKQLRRRQKKALPLLAVRGTLNRIVVELSTEAGRARGRRRGDE